MKTIYSVWLVPEKNDKKYLDGIIKDLGLKYDCPIFIPHLTLIGDLEDFDFDKLKKVIDEVFKKTKKFPITFSQLNQSDAFFKTVYIEFNLDQNLSNLFKNLASKTDKRDIFTFRPHISLMYKTMPKEEKFEIIKSLTIKDTFNINSVYIVAPKKGDEDFMDVKSWRVLYKKDFS